MTELTVEQFAAACNRIAGMEPADVPAAFDAAERIVLDGVGDNFAREQTADGMGWPPRKDPGDGHPLLNDTGALLAAAIGKGMGAVKRIVDGCELQLGVEVAEEGSLAGAMIHQEGGVIVPVNKKVLSWVDSGGTRHFAKRVVIPQREYMAMSEETIDKATEAVADELLAAMF